MAANEQQVIQLSPGLENLGNFEHVSTRYDARIQIGVKIADIMAPAFWAHHAVRLKPMDEIRARAEDGTWVAYMLVLDCSRTWAKVAMLAKYDLTTADVALSQASETEVKAFVEAHKVLHRGPHKWSVVRQSDKAVLAEGLELKDDATAWLDKHARTQVGAPKAAAQPEPATA